MIINFWDLLFDDGEWVNITDVVKGTHVTPISWLKEDRHGRASSPNQFFCINPLTQFGRKDANVTCYRNILIEFDELPLDDQFKLISSIPYSTITFSGGKSYHCVISLEQPCKDIKEYTNLVRRIYAKLPDCDKSTKNPSRLSRTPGAKRDTGELQSLINATRRINRKELEDWLGPDLKMEQSERIIAPMGRNGRRLLPARTLAFIEFGANEGGRNRALFINACELFRANYTKEEIVEIAMRVLDLSVTEIRQCIESARKAVSNEMV